MMMGLRKEGLIWRGILDADPAKKIARIAVGSAGGTPNFKGSEGSGEPEPEGTFGGIAAGDAGRITS